MVLMEVPRTDLSTARAEPWPDAYVASVDESALARLEDLFWELDVPGHRVELLEGQIVVSPMPPFWHGRLVTWLVRMFDPTCLANGWDQTAGSNLLLPSTHDIIVPDLMIVKDPDSITADPAVPADHALLVAEVCSPSSIRADRAIKPAACSLAGMPFYLLIDRFARPMSITLMSEPGEKGYRKAEAVQAGPDGSRLVVPEPFGITIDASTMPEFRSAKTRPED
jgi:Uma2 family endonuclease